MSALEGIRVIELSTDATAFAGKLLADMGADVILVEPPDGAAARRYPPFVDDEPGPERSLHWWHFNTSKRGITLDLSSDSGRNLLGDLIGDADVLIEGMAPDVRKALDFAALSTGNPGLVHAAITPYGVTSPRSAEPVTDLTILAGGGPVWSCGYDDHELPPIRGGGFQGYNTGAHYIVMSVLTALLSRFGSNEGQFIDVSLHAAANVTTEMASYHWLIQQSIVQRQTGRHAMEIETASTQVRSGDGRYVNTGVLPRTPREFAGLLRWIEDAGLRDEFPETVFIEMATQREHLDRSKIGEDDEIVAMFMAARDAMALLADRLPAKEFFLGAQRAGIPVGVVYSPEEAFEDEHFIARGFQHKVRHDDPDQTVRYPGAPYRFEKSAWRISRCAPHLGEHNEEVFAELSASAEP